MQIKPAYLDKPGACAFLALGESTFEELVKKEILPKSRLLSPKRVGWLVRELEEWAESRPVSDLLPPANTGARSMAYSVMPNEIKDLREVGKP